MKRKMFMFCFIVIIGFDVSALRLFRVLPNNRTEPADDMIIRASDVKSLIDFSSGFDKEYFEYITGPVKYLKVIRDDLILEYFFDIEGFLTKSVQNGVVSIYSYDIRRLYKEIETDGRLYRYEYDEQTNILKKDSDEKSETYFFDEKLNLIRFEKINDMMKHTAVFNYDKNHYLLESHHQINKDNYTLNYVNKYEWKGDFISSFNRVFDNMAPSGLQGRMINGVFEMRIRDHPIPWDRYGNWTFDDEYERKIEYYEEKK